MILKFGSQTVCPIIPNGVETGIWTLTVQDSHITIYVLDKAGGNLIGRTITSAGTYTLPAPVSGYVPVYMVAGSGYKFNYGQPTGMNVNAPFNTSFSTTGLLRTIAVTNGDTISVDVIED